jgi:hypothetical protein
VVFGLFNSSLEVLPLDQVRNVVLIVLILLVIASTLLFLHTLVALGKLAQRSQAVGTQLVQDTGDKLGEFLVLAVTVNGEGVGRDGSVD